MMSVSPKFYMIVLCLLSSVYDSSGSSTSSSSTTTRLTSNNNFFKSVSSKQQQQLPLQQCITNVISELQKSQPEDDTNTNTIRLLCMITSRSVTNQERTNVVQPIVVSWNDHSTTDDNNMDDTIDINSNHKVILSNNQQIMIVQPNNIYDISSSSSSCITNLCPDIIYIPSMMDIQRNEGLLDILGPMLESIIQYQQQHDNDMTKKKKPILYIILPNDSSSNEQQQSLVQQQMELAMISLIPHLITNNHSNIKLSLQDIFQQIQYIPIDSIYTNIIKDHPHVDDTTTLSSIMEHMKVSSTNTNSMISTNHINYDITNHKWMMGDQNLYAAHILGPISRNKLQTMKSSIQRICTEGGGSSTTTNKDDDNNDVTITSNDKVIFIPNFGELCDAIVQQEMIEWNDDTTKKSKNDIVFMIATTTTMGKQIMNHLYHSIYMYMTDMYCEQMNLLQKQCFSNLKKNLSKIMISPNLHHDMMKIGQESISTFITSATKLLPYKALSLSSTSSSHISYMTSYMTSTQRTYIRKVHDYIQNRILLARATGKFRPIPRKGITVGLHWLLPKPFGNDYRQEPYMVHATDNMVYVPTNSKLMDVSDDTVLSGEWKNQIVPHPPGNDMLYMQ